MITFIYSGGSGADFAYSPASGSWIVDPNNPGPWGGVYHGNDGNDHLFGFFANNLINGDADEDWLYGNTGDDELNGGSDADHLFGKDGYDELNGGSGTDHLYGEGGNDRLDGGEGGDVLNGGGGLDEARYDDSDSAVTVNLATGIGFGGTAQGDTLVDIEQVYGSAHGDALTGDDEQNDLFGGNGNDTLHGGGEHDDLNGDAGNDLLYGDAGTDMLSGDGDHDTLKGGGGADILSGGDGTDTASYLGSLQGVGISLESNVAQGGDAEGDTLLGIENLTGSAYRDQLWGDEDANVLRGMNGNDTLKGAGGFDTLWGGAGHDELFGHADPDVMYGEAGNDILDGGPLNDVMDGGLGDDIYVVDNPHDTLFEAGGQGLDTARTSTSWSLTPGADVETLRTTNDNGTTAIDLAGNSTGNAITGNAGSNVINGRVGGDQLTGLGGEDVFLFDTALDGTFDFITDFNVPLDTIRLDQTIFSSSLGLGSVAGSQFVIGTAASDANHRIIYNDVTGDVLYDGDGTGAAAAIRFAQVSAGLALTNFDFFVVA